MFAKRYRPRPEHHPNLESKSFLDGDFRRNFGCGRRVGGSRGAVKPRAVGRRYIRVPSSIWTRRPAALALASAIAVGGGLATEWKARDERRAQEQIAAQQTLRRLAELRTDLEGQLSATLYLGSGIEAILRAQDGRFEREQLSLTLNLLRERHPMLRNLAIAPDNRVELVAPLHGNESVIGLDYRANREQWPGVERVIKTRRPFLAGPVDLV